MSFRSHSNLFFMSPRFYSFEEKNAAPTPTIEQGGSLFSFHTYFVSHFFLRPALDSLRDTLDLTTGPTEAQKVGTIACTRLIFL